MTRALLFGLFSIVMVGCGAPITADDSTTPTASDDDGAGCHPERPVGSNISREVCRTPEEVRRDREDARNLMTPGKVSPTPTGSTP